MVTFRAATAGTQATNWQFDPINGASFSPQHCDTRPLSVCPANRVAFNRENRGLFALNMDTVYTWSPTLKTSLPDGQYCNVIVSADPYNCDSSAKIKVSGGYASFTVPTLDAVAIFVV
jgi:hypothetical protein